MSHDFNVHIWWMVYVSELCKALESLLLLRSPNAENGRENYNSYCQAAQKLHYRLSVLMFSSDCFLNLAVEVLDILLWNQGECMKSLGQFLDPFIALCLLWSRRGDPAHRGSCLAHLYVTNLDPLFQDGTVLWNKIQWFSTLKTKDRVRMGTQLCSNGFRSLDHFHSDATFLVSTCLLHFYLSICTIHS